jgi:hypothetical protein
MPHWGGGGNTLPMQGGVHCAGSDPRAAPCMQTCGPMAPVCMQSCDRDPSHHTMQGGDQALLTVSKLLCQRVLGRQPLVHC